MQTKNKIIIGGIVVVIALFSLFTTVGKEVFVITMKYQDNIITYKAQSEAELDAITLKDQNDCFYFDGEYPYEEAPVGKDLSKLKTQVIKWEPAVEGGDMTDAEFATYITLIVILGLCVLAVANDDGSRDGGYYDGFDY